MIEILGSRVKVSILLYLGLRGGSTGRHMAKVLKISPSQVFKALRQLELGKVIKRYQDEFYYLNSRYAYYHEILSMLQKEAGKHKQLIGRFLPRISEERHVDPLQVYRLIELREPSPPVQKFSDILRERYA